MFGLTVTTTDTFQLVVEAIERAAFENFQHAAASISRDVKSTIVTAKGPSAPGTPPHTRRGALRSAIRYVADKSGAIIGPVFSIVGESGRAHEMGGEYKGDVFDERPYMLPGLERGIPRFGGDWRGSIGT